MAKVLIRDLDDRTVARLKKRAARNGRSLQTELHSIVARAAMSPSAAEGSALAARIRRKLGNRKHSDSTASVRDDRQR
jgi:plasmid stability protein